MENMRAKVTILAFLILLLSQAGASGNSGSSLRCYVTFEPDDGIPPTTTLTTTPSSADGSSGWFVTQPLVTLTSNEPATTYYSWISATGPWTPYAGAFSAPSGQTTLFYYSVDGASNTESGKNTLFRVDTSTPSSSVSAPSEGERISGASYAVSGSCSDTYSGVSKVEVSIDSGSWQLATGTASWSYNWAPSADGSHNIKSRATDAAGHVETPSSGVNVIVDRTAPSVTATSPADGAGSVAIDSSLTATFSEDMDSSTINTGTFTVSGGITGVISYNAPNRTATLNPDADLGYSTTYTATVTTGVRDLAGNTLSTNYTFAFHTAAPDASPPITLLTTTDPSSPGPGGWFPTPPLITLTANEPATTYYSWTSKNGPWTTYSGPFRAGGGVHSLYYYSVDTSDNAEAVKKQQFKVR